MKNIPTLTKQQKSTKYIDKINILTIFIIGGWMNTLKRIFVISLATLFSTTSVFAMPKKCKYPQYRQNHPEKCGQMAETSNANGAILLGGLTLAGIGIAMAAQTSSEGAHSTTATSTSIYQRTSNANINYNLSDTIVNRRVADWYINNPASETDTTIIHEIQSSENYIRNKNQFDAVNLAFAHGRDYTGKNITIAVVDDFNSYHGHAVYDLVTDIAPDADFTKYTVTNSANNFMVYDEIANVLSNTIPSDIYNNSWQIISTSNRNAAVAVYDENGAKTYNDAQQYMYAVTSENFVTQVINHAIDNDSIFVWAAGNESQTESGALSAIPLAFPEIQGHFVNVVALDTNTNQIAWYSNQCGITQNYCITAPGSRLTTDATTNTVSGTSFATPIVSGAIATIKEAFPYMSATQITELLFVTSKDMGDPGIDSVYGWGLLDMDNATRPVGTPKIVLSDDNIQPLTDTNVGGIAGGAIKNANVTIAFVDDFGRAFTTNLSDNINVVPYSYAFDKLQSDDKNVVNIFGNFEYGVKQNNLLKSNGLISEKNNSFTNFIGYKNQFDFGDVQFEQNMRIGISSPNGDENSLVSGFSNIYTATINANINWRDFGIFATIPETIIGGNMFMNVPVGRANNGDMIYQNTNVNLVTHPSFEFGIKYKTLSMGYIQNPDYMDEFYIMAKTQFRF